MVFNIVEFYPSITKSLLQKALEFGRGFIPISDSDFNLAKCFTVNGPLCYCNDINELFIKLFQTHVASDWRLFIDSSQRSLKAVLLHNGNEKPCIPIAHSVHLTPAIFREILMML